MAEQRQTPTQARRAAFGLAAVLAATTLTGGAAIAGLTRHAPAPPAARIVQLAPATPLATPPAWEGDD